MWHAEKYTHSRDLWGDFWAFRHLIDSRRVCHDLYHHPWFLSNFHQSHHYPSLIPLKPTNIPSVSHSDPSIVLSLSPVYPIIIAFVVPLLSHCSHIKQTFSNHDPIFSHDNPIMIPWLSHWMIKSHFLVPLTPKPMAQRPKVASRCWCGVSTAGALRHQIDLVLRCWRC